MEAGSSNQLPKMLTRMGQNATTSSTPVMTAAMPAGKVAAGCAPSPPLLVSIFGVVVVVVVALEIGVRCLPSSQNGAQQKQAVFAHPPVGFQSVLPAGGAGA